MKLQLPALTNLMPIAKTDPEQKLYTSRRYYTKFFRIPYLKRIKMVIKSLGKQKYNRLLDIGFGSGFLLPELSRHCDKLYGVDLHKNIPLVKDMLGKEGVEAKILSGNILNLPFQNESFDCILALSVLELVDDIENSIMEIKRIARDNATIIIGMPFLNKITEICYDKVIRSKYHRIVHKSDHFKIINFANKYLNIDKTLVYPFFLPINYALFCVLKAHKRRR